MSLSPESNSSKDEIDIHELFRLIWAGKWIIGGMTLAAAVLSVSVSLILPNIYRSEALLAPNDQEGADGLSALASQYGGLASLAGISIGGKAADRTAMGLEILKSRKFISDFIIRHGILVPLMASDGWDEVNREIIIDEDVYDASTATWVRDVSPPKETVPSLLEAYDVFTDLMSVNQDSKTRFVTITIDHHSPEIAKQWVDWLIRDLNSTVMQQDVSKAEQAIEYLNEQVEMTPLSGLREVFFRLIEEQTKTIMLAKITDEYLLKTLDPAFVPEEKASPKRALIVIFFTMLGGFVGLLLVFARRGNAR